MTSAAPAPHGQAARPNLDFVLGGFAKCGSTTLWSLLREHPELFLARASKTMKEPNFFTRNWDKGWDWYSGKFGNAKPGQLLGEASNSYSGKKWQQITLDRLLPCSPDVRFIFVVRDPFERIRSSIRHLAHLGRVDMTPGSPHGISFALGDDTDLLTNCCYKARIEPFISRLGQDRVHIVFLEDLKTNPAAVIRSCFTFLGVDPDVPVNALDRRLHDGAVRLYDMPEMRVLRRTPSTGLPLHKVSRRVQDQFLEPLGLRRPFGNTEISFTNEQQRLILDAVFEDAIDFLDEQDRPMGMWPSLQKAAFEQKYRELSG